MTAEGEKRPTQRARLKALRDIVLILVILVGGYFGLRAFLMHNAREDGFKKCFARGHSEARCTCVVDLSAKAASKPEAERQDFLEKGVEQCRPL